MSTLQDLVQKRIINECIIPARDKSGGYMVVVLDQRCLRILASCMRTSNLVNVGVLHLENIHLSRKPYRDLCAAYFITPTEESVKALCADFAVGKESKYAAAHLFLTAPLPEALDKLVTETLLKQKRLLSWIEMNLDFLVPESQAAILGLDKPLQIYSDTTNTNTNTTTTTNTSSSSSNSNIKSTALTSSCVAGIVSLLQTMEDAPIIRFSSETPCAKEIASQIFEKIQEMKKSPNHKFKSTTQPATLLVLDRGHDAIAPLLHEFSYQAMVYDVLEFKGNTFEYQSKTGEKRSLILDEHDDLWPQLRHLHLTDAYEIIQKQMQACKDMEREINDAKQSGDLRSIGDKITLYEKLKAQCSDYLEISDRLFRSLTTHPPMMTLCEAEQELATDKHNQSGIDVNMVVLKAKVKMLLKDQKIPMESKIRLVMVYIVTQGAQDKDELCTDAGISEDLRLPIDVISRMYPPATTKRVEQQKPRFQNPIMRLLTNTAKTTNEQVSAPVIRFVPNLQSILEQLIDDKLSETEYPFVEGSKPEISKPEQADAQNQQGKNKKFSRAVVPTWQLGVPTPKSSEPDRGPRIFVFVIGGASYSELRVTYRVGQKRERDIILATPTLLRPRDYVQGIAELDK